MNVNVDILSNSEPMFDIELNKSNILNIEGDENHVVYLSLKHLNESLVESVTGDSNYVSEDSVTLTEGSVEKDEDSIDIVTNDLSDEAMIISSPDTNPEDLKDEYCMHNTINDTISEEIVELRNNDVLLDNLESDKFNENSVSEIKEAAHTVNLNEILNNNSNEINYDNKIGSEVFNDINIIENNANSTELVQEAKSDTLDVNLDTVIDYTKQAECTKKSENILEDGVENNVMGDRNYDNQVNQQEPQLNLAQFDNEQMNLNKNLINATINQFRLEHVEKINDQKIMVDDDSSVHSELHMAFIKPPGVHQDNLDSTSDLDIVDLDEHEFGGSDWLYSAPCSLKNDQFDIDSTFSFSKMRLATEMINDSSALTLKLCNGSDYVQNFNDYVRPSLFQKEPTFQFQSTETISSTPCSNQHQLINSADNTEENFVIDSVSSSVNENFKIMENTFGLSPSDTVSYTTTVTRNLSMKKEPVIPDQSSTTEVCKSVDNSLLALKKFGASLKTNPYKPSARTIKRPVESKVDKVSVDEPSGVPKRKTSLRKPNDISKPRQAPSLLKLSPGIGKPLSKTASQILSPTIINGVEVRLKPQSSSEVTRRHTVVDVSLKNSKIATKITRPTSLIKPTGEFKIPFGIPKDVKPSRVSIPTVVPELKKRDSIPVSAQKQIAIFQETEIPRAIPARKNTTGIPLVFKPRKMKEATTRSETQPLLITPIHSENPPMISPALPVSNNPLNRTFDREDFQILKSLTNSNNNDADNPSMNSSSETLRSSTDSENNNRLLTKKSILLSKETENLGIYHLALKEEENLKKQVHTALNRQANELRSLRQPIQQKPRGIPMLKK